MTIAHQRLIVKVQKQRGSFFRPKTIHFHSHSVLRKSIPNYIYKKSKTITFLLYRRHVIHSDRRNGSGSETLVNILQKKKPCNTYQNHVHQIFI
jgi:hypothetical protein